MFSGRTALRTAPEGTASFAPCGFRARLPSVPGSVCWPGCSGGALLNFAAATDAQAQSRIGRLFSSPGQRIELDRLRNESDGGKNAQPRIERTGGEFRPESEPGPSVPGVTFNGIVIRSDGHRVAWIDGVETAEGETTPAGVRIDADHTPGGRLRIRLSHGRTSAVLEPGQFVGDGGRTHKAYDRRSNHVAGGLARKHAIDADDGAGEGGAADMADSRKSASSAGTATDVGAGITARDANQESVSER